MKLSHLVTFFNSIQFNSKDVYVITIMWSLTAIIIVLLDKGVMKNPVKSVVDVDQEKSAVWSMSTVDVDHCIFPSQLLPALFIMPMDNTHSTV